MYLPCLASCQRCSTASKKGAQPQTACWMQHEILIQKTLRYHIIRDNKSVLFVVLPRCHIYLTASIAGHMAPLLWHICGIQCSKQQNGMRFLKHTFNIGHSPVIQAGMQQRGEKIISRPSVCSRIYNQPLRISPCYSSQPKLVIQVLYLAGLLKTSQSVRKELDAVDCDWEKQLSPRLTLPPDIREALICCCCCCLRLSQYSRLTVMLQLLQAP